MTAGSNVVAVLGEESSLKGRFVGQDLTVLGHFDGELKVGGVVRIGRQAAVKARIEAGAVEVEGTFEGEIRTGRLLFGASARARGVFLSDRLTIHDGAVVEGSVNQPPVLEAAVVVEPEASPAEQNAPEAARNVAPAERTAGPVEGDRPTETPAEPEEGPHEANEGASPAALAVSSPVPVTLAEAGLLAAPPWQPHPRRRHRRRRHM